MSVPLGAQNPIQSWKCICPLLFQIYPNFHIFNKVFKESCDWRCRILVGLNCFECCFIKNFVLSSEKMTLGPGVINHILLERYSQRNWATGYFWNTSRSALLGNFYSLVHFQCWSKERKNNHLKAASYKSHSTIHFCSIFNAALFLTQSLSDFYQQFEKLGI